MKFMLPQLMLFFQNKTTRQNLIALAKFWLLLFLIVAIFTIGFHVLMGYEGREYSWITGVYWSLTVMSTLGFGDITFTSDVGMVFSLVVLITGIILLLIILPFTFIKFFYAPWLEAQSSAKTLTRLPVETHGHVVIAGLDPITRKLIDLLKKKKVPYVVLAPDLQTGLEMHDGGHRAVIGAIDDPETYRRVRVRNAAMVVATSDDLINTNISFTVREITEKVPIVANADNANSLDILGFTGNMHVFQFMKMLGESLADKTLSVNRSTSVIGSYNELLLAAAPVMGTLLEGRKLFKSRIREETGLTVVGVWEKGKLLVATPATIVQSTMVLVMAGSEAQIKRFEAKFARPRQKKIADAPVLILGGGRVGNAAAALLKRNGVSCKIIEKRANFIGNNDVYVQGDAADFDTLKKAGIEKARSVIITTHNDDMNIYLTFYCRQLRPDMQIISRANMERTVSKLHRAGADLVMSYAAMGASAIIKILLPDEVTLFAEGLSVFKSKVPASIKGKTLAESRIRENTGCSVVAILRKNQLMASPDPETSLNPESELILIGTAEAEERFLALVD